MNLLYRTAAVFLIACCAIQKIQSINRRPLAVVHESGVITDTHHDGHGKREMMVMAGKDGVLVTIRHSDGRSFQHLIVWKELDHQAVTLYDISQMGK